jgi:hypothetical protein
MKTYLITYENVNLKNETRIVDAKNLEEAIKQIKGEVAIQAITFVYSEKK